MNRFVAVLLLAATITSGTAGCSGDDPESRLGSINTLMAKDFPLTEQQRTDVDKLVAEGKKLMEAGKPEQAGAAFGEAIEILEFAEDAAMFNKSE